MPPCDTDDVDVNVTLTYNVCRDHGHGRMTSATMESNGVPVMEIIDAMFGLIEETLTQFADSYPGLLNLDGWDDLPERAQKHLAALVANDLMLTKVAERDYHTSMVGAMLQFPMA